MNKDRIIELAKQAGFLIESALIPLPYVIAAKGPDYKVDDELKRFYELTRNEVLEEAAKVCDTTPPQPFRPSIEAAYAIRSMKT